MEIKKKRIIAYIIDLMIISILASMLTNVFVKSEDYTKLNEEGRVILNNYLEEQTEENSEEVLTFTYAATKMLAPSNFANIILYSIYFGILPKFTTGQTIGKRLSKIKIQSSEGKNLNILNLMIRVAVLYGVLINLISAILLVIAPRVVYSTANSYLMMLQLIMFLACIFGSLGPKGRGLHERLSATEVVSLEDSVQDKMSEWKNLKYDEQRKKEDLKSKHTTVTKGSKTNERQK